MTHRIGEDRWLQRILWPVAPHHGGSRARGHAQCGVIGGVLLGVLAVWGPPEAFAAGVVGTGTPESCTEAALDAALAGGGLVTFDCGAGPITITISGAKDIAQDTTLDGGGLVTIDGNNTVQITRNTVFSTNSGITFTVQNLTITNGAGYVGPIPTGGILNADNATLVITNCTLSHNVYGGGIYNGSGTLNVTSSTFVGNDAFGQGGGISNHGGTVTVSNSTFSGNSAEYGGGISNQGGMVTVTNTTFSENGASDGGAIHNEDGIVTVTSSTFVGNSAEHSAPPGDVVFGEGGGIWNGGGGTLTVTTVPNPAVGCATRLRARAPRLLESCSLRPRVSARVGTPVVAQDELV